MKHLTIRQAIIGSRRSSISALARAMRNDLTQNGFDVLSEECLDAFALKVYDASGDPFHPILEPMVVDLLDNGFDYISRDCLVEFCNKIYSNA